MMLKKAGLSDPIEYKSGLAAESMAVDSRVDQEVSAFNNEPCSLADE